MTKQNADDVDPRVYWLTEFVGEVRHLPTLVDNESQSKKQSPKRPTNI